MNTHYTYFLILAASIAGPLALSFDKKVKFYTKWKYLLPAMLLPALFYIFWDIGFTNMGVWSFNDKYVAGTTAIRIPLEEILFFFVVPYCCVFIYECIICYFPNIITTKLSKTILIVLGVILFGISFLFRDKLYTFSTFLLCGFFLVVLMALHKNTDRFNTSAFIIAWLIILIPFLLVNGFLTALPVVQYNSAENLGIRIYTIPVEDIFYGMLLVFLNIEGYELARQRKEKNKTI